MSHLEYDIQVAISDYLKIQYSKVLFRHDLGRVRLYIDSAIKTKQIQKEKGWPDLNIIHPVGIYHGFFLEIKLSTNEIYNKHNKFKNDHVKQQQKILAWLRSLGYWAEFGFGIEDCKMKIDNYLKEGV